MKHDLTEGSISKNLIKFFLPIAAGTMFQQLYNAVDAIIVGKYVGKIALAAVGGSAANINNLIIGFFVALSSGCAVIIAHLFGAKDYKTLHRATGTAVVFCIIAGAVLSAFGIVFSPQMLTLMNTPEDTMADSVIYLRIIFGGVIAQLLYNIESGILRAVGDSRSPFIYLFICTFINILLDYVFVVFFNLGVAGVAYATVISQIVSALLATIKLCLTKEEYRISLKSLNLDRNILSSMMKIGIPVGLQSSMYSVSNLLIQVAVNLLGTTVVASWTLSSKVDGIYWACSDAVGIAIMNFSAQNYGAGRIDRVKDGEKISFRIFLAVTVFFSAAILASAKLVLPFFNSDPDVIEETWTIFKYIVPFYFTWTLIEIISGVLRGVGDALMPVIICGLGICLLRVIWVFVIYPMYPTLETICISYPVSWTVTDIAFIIYYYKGKWLNKIQPTI